MLKVIYTIAIGGICFIFGMITEFIIENSNKKKPETEQIEEPEQPVEIIEINDPDNYFIPF